MLYAVLCRSRFSDRREQAEFLHDLGQRLLFWAVRQESGEAGESLSLCRTSQGKPYFENSPIRFSISHCPGLVCCAIGREEVGIDAEPIRPCRRALAERICTAEELAYWEKADDPDGTLMKLWTLKEGRMKLSGEGFRFGFRNAAFSFQNGMPVSLEPGVHVKCYDSIPGFLLSACSLGELPEAPVILEENQLF